MGEQGSHRGRVRWGDLPGWLQVAIGLALLVGLGSGAHAVTGSGRAGSSPAGSTSTVRHSQTSTPRPTAPLFLADAPHVAVSAAGNGELGGGVANVAGASFKRSVRQLYSANCCSDSQSVTYSVPNGYSSLEASIGLESGGSYASEYSPAVTFEVDAGGPSDRLYVATMSYGEGAQIVDVKLDGAGSLILSTNTHADNCFTCEADAVWGDARLVP